jgi:hypothetical protein
MMMQKATEEKDGVEGYRSPCLYVANVALYHMSYNPFDIFIQCSAWSSLSEPNVLTNTFFPAHPILSSPHIFPDLHIFHQFSVKMKPVQFHHTLLSLLLIVGTSLACPR